MNNLIGEIGAVLSPAVSGALRDATGGWSAAIFVDAGLIAGRDPALPVRARGDGRPGAGPAGTFRRAPSDVYGVVVDSVNVSVLRTCPCAARRWHRSTA